MTVRKKVFLASGLIFIFFAMFFYGLLVENRNKRYALGYPLDPKNIAPPGHHTVASNLISLRSSGFEPQVLTVKKGTTVIFRNDEIQDRWPIINQALGGTAYPEFDQDTPLASAESRSFVFDELGEWEIIDQLHPQFTARIIVVEYLNEADMHNF